MTNGDNDKDWADERVRQWMSPGGEGEYLCYIQQGGGMHVATLMKQLASLLRIVARDQRHADIDAVFTQVPETMGVNFHAIGHAIMNASPKESK